MKVSTDKFIEKTKVFLKNEIVSQLSGENRRFWIGVALQAANAKTLPLLADMFPGISGFLPIIAASGVVEDGEIDVDLLEEMLMGGFELSGNEMTFSFMLPKMLDPEQKQISIKLTPRVWSSFKSEFE